MGATKDDTERKFYGAGQKAITVSERGVMGQHKKLFLLYGTFFAVSGLALDAIRGRDTSYWWIDVLGAYAAAANVAVVSQWFSNRAARNRARG